MSKEIQQWEYETLSDLTFGRVIRLKDNLRLMGSQGWELCFIFKWCFVFTTFIFKRPKQQQ